MSYGADPSGLIYGYAFSPEGIATRIDAAAALTWLREDATGEIAFVWLHFNGTHTTTGNWISRHLSLPEEFSDALKEASRSTRIECAHRSLIGVVNDVVHDPLGAPSMQVATLWLCVEPRCLLSVRTQPLHSVDRLRQAVNAGENFPTPLSLVVHLLRDQADVLAHIMRTTTRKIDDLEDRFLEGRLPERASMGGMRRNLVRLQRLLAPEPASLFRLLNRPPEWLSAEDAQDLRHSTEEFSVVLRDMAGLQERIKLLQEEIVTLLSERTNRSVFVLTAVTVLALPINLTSGLFGMNVGGVPLSQNPAGFWIVFSLMSLVTTLAAWFTFRGRND